MKEDNGAGTVTIAERVPVDQVFVKPERWPWEEKPKLAKILWTLHIEAYPKEITNITFPLLAHYAKKIGAEFRQITTRRWPDYPAAYEKLQIHELGKQAEWNLYIDADTLIHPDFFDLTCQVGKDTVLHNGRDMAGMRWTYDQYFKRDGRNLGSCNWLALASDWCLDLWTPLDIPLEEALANIHPTVGERAGGIDAAHLLDDYTLSRNIARYGLKFVTVKEICDRVGVPASFLWHHYNMPTAQKVTEMRGVLKGWRLE